ncbi:MAG: penicillin-binding transpeptidase domain-containing protein [Lachnospiraceae bacterium]|nr:penicillin-binding transpeptidase domain-containing protein [Lachnospiraceae bacterium]
MKKGVLQSLFREFKERFYNLIFSRMFILLLVIFILFAVLVQRLFTLQIVNGATYQNNFKLKILKEKSIKSTRGKIYDRNGKVLAYDELAYSVTIEDNYDSTSSKNQELNDTIYRLINIIEEHNNKLINDFEIVLDKNGNFVFAVEDKKLLRFLADAYGHTKTSELLVKEKTATPSEVIEFLAGDKKFSIGKYETIGNKKVFHTGSGYTKEELLKMITVRYAMNLNSFQKYIATTVATSVNEETVAVIMENKDQLQGVDIAEDTVRKYIDDESFSPILGYTGKISQEELDALSLTNDSYELNDMVGKSGIEKVMEEKLQGTKGHEEVYVDNLGKVVEVAKEVAPEAGNDLYLTINADLQSAVYKIIEQKLAGILVQKIKNVKEYNQGAEESAANIIIPIDDVYFALFNNNIIDISHLQSSNAKANEADVHQAFISKQSVILDSLKEELLNTSTPYTSLTKEMQVYESFIVSMLLSKNSGILISSEIDKKDETYQKWKEETISLKDFLNHAIAMNWIDITKIKVDSQYSDSTEVYNALVENILNNLSNNNDFSKKIFKYMIYDSSITGRQICMLLFEQKIIMADVAEKESVENGTISPYNFIMNKIKNLEITPAQLALDPCTGSSVVTDVNTGEVLACVSYPSYDNNKLANTIDADYYNQLTNDLSNPLYSYATQQKTAPGSTFKMISSVAGLEEGVISTGDTITCIGQFEKFSQGPKCWIYPSRHGSLNVSGAITHSCNYFFYEVGFRLGADGNGKYNSDIGISKIAKYADLFGLSELSGIELSEAEPQISTEDAVRSAIGQGTHSYTTAGLARYVTTVANSGSCYNLSLLDKIEDSSGNILEDYSPKLRNTITISDSIWNAVHQGMRGVVQDSSSFSDYTLTAAGKTGTAQQIRTRPNHALFVGYAPYENPEIAIATRIAYGYTSSNAAEVSKDIFKYYFNVEDIDNIITGEAETPESSIAGD